MKKNFFVVFFSFLSVLGFLTMAMAGEWVQQTGADNPFDGVDLGKFSSPTLGDVDGDGDSDAIIGNEDGYLFLFLNNGDGTFTEQTGANNPFDQVDLGSKTKPHFVNFTGSSLDLFVAAQRESVAVVHYFQNESSIGSISFSDNGDSESSDQNPFKSFNASSTSKELDIAFSDIDGEGIGKEKFEPIVGDLSGFLKHFDFTDSSPDQFQLIQGSPYETIVSGGGALIHPSFSDANDDGFDDIFVGRGSSGDIELFLNLNPGFSYSESVDFTPSVINQDKDTPTTPYGSPDPAPLDFDNDGDDDFFVGAADGTIYLFLNGIPPVDGDYNGDGLVDISDAIIALKTTAGISPGDTVSLENKISGDGSGLGIPDAIFALQKVAQVRDP